MSYDNGLQTKWLGSLQFWMFGRGWRHLPNALSTIRYWLWRLTGGSHPDWEDAFYGDEDYWAEHGALHLAMAEGDWAEVARLEARDSGKAHPARPSCTDEPKAAKRRA
jgi:hypothetical protein